jgi:hypothetical protein
MIAQILALKIIIIEIITEKNEYSIDIDLDELLKV